MVGFCLFFNSIYTNTLVKVDYSLLVVDKFKDFLTKGEISYRLWTKYYGLYQSTYIYPIIGLFTFAIEARHLISPTQHIGYAVFAH